MGEVSNKSLAALLVVAIVVSLGGTFISLNRLSSIGRIPLITGLAVDLGKVNVTIVQKITIDTPENLIWFGEGSVNPSASYADLWSNGTRDPNWENSSAWMPDPTNDGGPANNNSDFIIIENQGNVDVNLTVKANVNADDFIGGASGGGPLFEYWATDNETNSCIGTLEGDSSSRTTLNTTDQNVCDNLNATDETDTVRLYAYIRIPSDATGSKNSTLTFTSDVVSS